MMPSRGLVCSALLLSCFKQHVLAFSSTSLKRARPQLCTRSEFIRKAKNDDSNGVTEQSSDVSRTTSRRKFLTNAAVAFIASTALVSTSNVQDSIAAAAAFVNTTSSSHAEINGIAKQKQQKQQKSFEPIDIQKVAQENKVNITLMSKDENAKVYIDRTSFDRVKERTYPSWIPSFLLPKPQLIGRISDAQLLMASALAGSFTEFIRCALLYPITTVKTRVQTTSSRTTSWSTVSTISSEESELGSSSFQDILKTSFNNIRAQVNRGDLYAGFLPAAIVGAPASGVYFAVSDVMKKQIRQLNEISSSTSIHVDEFSVLLLSALVADVVSLAVRTPAVTFSTRRQAQPLQSQVTNVTTVDNSANTGLFFADFVEENDATEMQIQSTRSTSDIEGKEEAVIQSYEEDWWNNLWKDCWQQLPTIIITDLPYLLLKISLVRILADGNENIAQFEILNIFAACVAAALTTPFDVARTAILVDSDNDTSTGIDGGSREDVVEAMRRIAYGYEYNHGGKSMKEENDINAAPIKKPRIQNLYAGWLERVAYLGIGVAWFQPIRTLSYYALRDALLLGVFR